jgi:hypothetical protein
VSEPLELSPAPTAIVPALLVTHGLIFMVLVAGERVGKGATI